VIADRIEHISHAAAVNQAKEKVIQFGKAKGGPESSWVSYSVAEHL
jgi:hypothetical protein